MDKYIIYCTEEQTKKALELGAPITTRNDRFDERVSPICKESEQWLYAIIPTAEEMIGWLEEQYLYITIRYTNDVAKHWQADVDCANCIDPECGKHLVDFDFSSRKEATLAAIDAALEYLSNNKNESTY